MNEKRWKEVIDISERTACAECRRIRVLLEAIADERRQNGFGDVESALGRDGAEMLYTLLDVYTS